MNSRATWKTLPNSVITLTFPQRSISTALSTATIYALSSPSISTKVARLTPMSVAGSVGWRSAHSILILSLTS